MMVDKNKLSAAYNPYLSCLVAASAGTGKTYQLSRRFVYLVGSGADPGGILTITFTRKAAGEMRARILQVARDLRLDPECAQLFDQEMAMFYQQALEHAQDEFLLKPPLSAYEVGESILQASQRLKISTIDSLFMDWVQRFPLETLDPLNQHKLSSIRLSSRDDQKLIKRKSENDALVAMLELLEHEGLAGELFNGDISLIRRELQEIMNVRGYLWFIQVAEGKSGFIRHRPAQISPFSQESDLLRFLDSDLMSISSVTKLHESVHAALKDGSIEILKKTGLITKDFLVSGRYIRGKKREELLEKIERVEDALVSYINKQKYALLNRRLVVYERFWEALEESRNKHKLARGIIDFDDLLRGAFRLFKDEHAISSRYLIQRGIAHLMIDEFQDTSLLQWQIFESIALELLSGTKDFGLSSGAHPSVFLVGDIKQSIYGFREAEPRLMNYASQVLGAFGLKNISMQESYRSSRSVIDFVNAYFTANPLEGFQPHSTAKNRDGDELVPDLGSVNLLSLNTEAEISCDDEEGSSSFLEREAETVAVFLKSVFEGERRGAYQMYDKGEGFFRPIAPQDVVILYRNATHAGLFVDALSAKGIKTVRSDIKHFFTRSEISDYLALMKVLAFSEDILSLAHLLRSPLMALNEEEIFRLLYNSREEEQGERSADIIAHLPKCAPIGSWLVDWLKNKRQDVLSTIQEIFTNPIFLKAYATAYPQSEFEIAEVQIRELYKICMYLLVNRNMGSLHELLAELKQMAEDENLSYERESVHAVRLMTMHAAKGLEFGMVVCVGLGLNWHKRDKYWLKGGVDFNEHGVYYVGKHSDHPQRDPEFERKLALVDQRICEESDRLLYVAFTRSIQHLVFFAAPAERGQFVSYSSKVKTVLAAKMRKPDLIEQKDGISVTSWWGADSRQRQSNDRKTRSDAVAETHIGGILQSRQKTKKEAAKLDRLFSARQKSAREEFLGLKGSYQARFPSSTAFSVMALQFGASDPEISVTPVLGSENSGTRDASMSLRMSAIIGDFIHAGLEAYIKKRLFIAEQVWLEMFQKHGVYDEAHASIHRDDFSSAIQEMTLTCQIPALNKLLEQAKRCETELAMVSRRKNDLWQGRADLVCFLPADNIVIIDFKTGEIPLHLLKDNPRADRDREDIIKFVKGKGYEGQLNLYAEILQDIYPKQSIRKGVLLTKARALIYF